MADNILWLMATLVGISATLLVIAMGTALIRHAINDLSNSTAREAFQLRIFRILPGAVITGLGCIGLGVMLVAIVRLQFNYLP